MTEEAYAKVNGKDFRLLWVIPSVMDSLLKKKKTKDIRGIPVYFSSYQRVWPLPEDESMQVTFKECT